MLSDTPSLFSVIPAPVVAAIVGGLLSGVSALVIGHLRVKNKVAVHDAEIKEIVDKLDRLEGRAEKNEERLENKLDAILEKIEYLTRAMNVQFLGCPNHRNGGMVP